MIRKVANQFFNWVKVSSGTGLILQCYAAFHYSSLWIIKTCGSAAGYYVDSGFLLEVIHTSWLFPIWALVAIGVFFEISRTGHQGFSYLLRFWLFILQRFALYFYVLEWVRFLSSQLRVYTKRHRLFPSHPMSGCLIF